ncbi:MAG: hypothetical protein AB7G10_21635 [Reyranellaceae bacterium]
MARRAAAGRRAGTRAASWAHVVTMPMPPVERVAEIDAEARRVSAGRCGRWTSPGKLHVGFAEAAHRDAFVLWLSLSGIECG